MWYAHRHYVLVYVDVVEDGLVVVKGAIGLGKAGAFSQRNANTAGVVVHGTCGSEEGKGQGEKTSGGKHGGRERPAMRRCRTQPFILYLEESCFYIADSKRNVAQNTSRPPLATTSLPRRKSSKSYQF